MSLAGPRELACDDGAYLLGNMRRTSETKNIGRIQRVKDKIREVTGMQDRVQLFGIACLQVVKDQIP